MKENYSKKRGGGFLNALHSWGGSSYEYVLRRQEESGFCSLIPTSHIVHRFFFPWNPLLCRSEVCSYLLGVDGAYVHVHVSVLFSLPLS
jgi:hypothetical protein